MMKCSVYWMMDRTSTILAEIELDSILLRIDRFIFVLKQVYALLETSSGFLRGAGEGQTVCYWKTI